MDSLYGRFGNEVELMVSSKNSYGKILSLIMLRVRLLIRIPSVLL